MAQEGFDRNVASRMPSTKSGKPKRPWQVPQQVEQTREQNSRPASEDLSMDNLSMDKSSIDKKSMDTTSREDLFMDKSVIDKKSMDEMSIDKSSMDRLSIQKKRGFSDTFTYLFEHFLPKFDPASQTLLLWLVWLSDEQGQTPPVSYKDLSQRCGMSSKTAARTIKDLIKEGVIQIKKNAYSREATVYAINLPKLS